MSYAIACLHSSVLLNNEQDCRKIGEDKIAVRDKTAGLYVAALFEFEIISVLEIVLVPVKIFQYLTCSIKIVFQTLFEVIINGLLSQTR